MAYGNPFNQAIFLPLMQNHTPFSSCSVFKGTNREMHRKGNFLGKDKSYLEQLVSYSYSAQQLGSN
jgi:hypothetical protein